MLASFGLCASDGFPEKKDKTYTVPFTFIYLNQIKTHLHEYIGSNSTPPEVWPKKTPKVFFSNGTKARVKAAATAPIIDATKMKKGKSIQSQSCRKIRFGKTNRCAKSYRKSSSPNAAPKSFRFYQLSYFVPSWDTWRSVACQSSARYVMIPTSSSFMWRYGTTFQSSSSYIQSPAGLVMVAFDLKCRYFLLCQQPPWNLHLSS